MGEPVDYVRARTWAEALEVKAQRPDAVPIAGGTDVLVEVNFGRLRPPAFLDLTALPELAEWGPDHGRVRLGATVTYSRIIAELAGLLPGLAMAARTIGSPQIRNRGSVGGNLGSASPAGDAHPILLATGADIEVESVRGRRLIPATEFYTGVKKHALAADELIAAVLIPPVTGPQQFSKIGTRNAMVIAVASFALTLHPEQQRVGTGIGSAAPTPLRAREAEALLGSALVEEGLWDSGGELPEPMVEAFAERVVAAASPIDDIRGTARYRRQALGVLARRALTWAWNDYRGERSRRCD